MVVGKTINNLKDRPHDEKKAVAGGIAITVVVILLIGWGFLFLRRIQNNPATTLQGGAVPSDQFNLNVIQNTAQQLNGTYGNPVDELKQLRDNAAQNQASQYNATPSGGSSDFGGY